MSDDHCVIVGASHAAASLAAALRSEGWAGAISIIGDEPHLPYHRPPLSKAYFCGDKSAAEILIRPESFYAQNNIDLMLGSRVEDIDVKAKTLTLHDGATVSYTKLALTTGARVRKIPIPGSDLAGVYYLRDLGDVDQIKKYVVTGKRAVIVGGGYIGLETAASLRKLGMEVTVLEALPRVLQRVTAPELSAFYTRVHREEGVDLRTEVAIEGIVGDGKVHAVKLADGSEIECNLVVIGVGVIPETALAEKAGLKVDNGIVVNEHAVTSNPDILAAGDCTQHYNPIYQTHLRLESVQNATDQAKIAAKSLCGKPLVYNSLPWFWSDQYDLKLQIAGLSQGFDQVVIRGDIEASRSFAAFYYKAGRLIAVDAVNRPKEFMMAKRALTEGKSADPALVQDEAVDVKDIFTL